MVIDSPIHSARLMLRSLNANDSMEAYLSWLHDPVVNAFLEVRHNLPLHTTDLQAYVDIQNSSTDSLLLGIFLKNENQHIGTIKLGPLNKYHLVADLGFLIGARAYWGKGFASEAIQAVTDYGFSVLGLVKVNAGCYFQNKGSQRALQKAGFEMEGVLHAQWVYGEGRTDGLIFGKIHPEHTY